MNKRTADTILGVFAFIVLDGLFFKGVGSPSHDPTDPQFFNKMLRQSKDALKRKKEEERVWRAQNADLIRRWSNGDQSAWIEISAKPVPYNPYDDIAMTLREYWDFLHLQPSFGMSLQDSMLATFTDKKKMNFVIDNYRNNPEWKARLVSEYNILPSFIDMPPVSLLDDFFKLRRVIEENSLAQLPKYRQAAKQIAHRDRVGPMLSVIKGGKNNEPIFALLEHTYSEDFLPLVEEYRVKYPELSVRLIQDNGEYADIEISGPKETLWASFTEYMNPININDPLFREHFERLLKRKS